MSVNNQYYTVDWNELIAGSNQAAAGFDDFTSDALDAEAPWIEALEFGPQIDPYYFESWNGLMKFNDWFRAQRKMMDDRVVGPFARLFLDVGLLHEDATYAPKPILEGLEVESEWLLGAMSPDTVRRLVERADALDLKALENEFQRGLENAPCKMFSDEVTIGSWVLALKDGLLATMKQGRGLILGAA